MRSRAEPLPRPPPIGTPTPHAAICPAIAPWPSRKLNVATCARAPAAAVNEPKEAKRGSFALALTGEQHANVREILLYALVIIADRTSVGELNEWAKFEFAAAPAERDERRRGATRDTHARVDDE